MGRILVSVPVAGAVLAAALAWPAGATAQEWVCTYTDASLVPASEQLAGCRAGDAVLATVGKGTPGTAVASVCDITREVVVIRHIDLGPSLFPAEVVCAYAGAVRVLPGPR